ncbi:MAG TPA: hypothetical protein VGV64_02710 [Thermoplasmata archaeon]|nr:hypothetical protein [Thermoplasmata archaeon]HEV2428741.1 hypothetical protein [Thermoplasmata archaeon]
MAKKGKKRLEEQEELRAFRFPDFDERKFVAHEYEQSIATAIAVGFALALALASWEIDRTGLPGILPPVLGLLGIVALPGVLRRLRPLSTDYTRGDWFWLILTGLLGWLGLWFLLLNLVP